MSTEQNKSVVRAFFEEVFNKGNLDRLDEIIAADYRGLGPAIHGVTGPERAKHAVTSLRAAFPDIHFTVDDIVAEEDKVVVRVTFRGTHKGAYLGVAPTGRQITVSGAEMARLADGKIVEAVWHHHDELHLLHQLGVTLPIKHGEG